jgi:hypothetical protein
MSALVDALYGMREDVTLRPPLKKLTDSKSAFRGWALFRGLRAVVHSQLAGHLGIMGVARYARRQTSAQAASRLQKPGGER